MAYDVTSWFIEQTKLLAPSNLVRKFTIGSSDYSSYVTEWPKFRKSWDEIRPKNLTMKLANEDKALNFLRDNKLVLASSSSIEFGYTHPNSGDELITLFTGTTSQVRYSGGEVAITIVDKFQKLTERIVGTDDEPVDYTSSNYLPADIAWYLVTSYGGYSTIESSSNPDIDYDAWLTWAEVFSNSAVLAKALFDGQKVAECIRKIGRMTRSAIYIKEDRITFKRFSSTDSYQTQLDSNSILDLELSFDNEDTVNKQYVFADYSVDSEYFQTTVHVEDTASINSYGLKEDKEEDDNIWYVGSGPALDLAQRITLTNGVPFDRLEVETTLVGVIRSIGETLSISDGFHSIDQGYRIMEQEIDLDKGILKFNVNRSQYTTPFILDTSTLNGPDVLT